VGLELAPKMPIKEAVDYWNQTAAKAGWKQVSKLNDARRDHLRNRLREHGLDGWQAAINRAAISPYLAGTDPPGWFAFDWIIKPTNFLKVWEGNYDRSRSNEREDTSTEGLLARLKADRERATSH